MRKSEKVYTHRGFTLKQDERHKVLISPKGKRYTRLNVGQIPHVSVSHMPMAALSPDDQASRWSRGENVRTRQNLFMQPTEATIKRFRRLEGDVKQGHNERVKREAR